MAMLSLSPDDLLRKGILGKFINMNKAEAAGGRRFPLRRLGCDSQRFGRVKPHRLYADKASKASLLQKGKKECPKFLLKTKY